MTNQSVKNIVTFYHKIFNLTCDIKVLIDEANLINTDKGNPFNLFNSFETYIDTLFDANAISFEEYDAYSDMTTFPKNDNIWDHITPYIMYGEYVIYVFFEEIIGILNNGDCTIEDVNIYKKEHNLILGLNSVIDEVMEMHNTIHNHLEIQNKISQTVYENVKPWSIFTNLKNIINGNS